MEDDECSVAYSSPSFYVADDEKSIAIVDLLEYIKSKDMTVQFYLNLLQDLTVMMDEVESYKSIFLNYRIPMMVFSLSNQNGFRMHVVC